MKRNLTLTLILTVLVTLVLSASASAATVASGECGAEGDNLTWTLDDSGLLTISGEGEMANYYVYNNTARLPWSINDVKTVNILSGVTSIGKNAFYNCTGLVSVFIPDSVISIGNWAFSHCSALRSVIISDNTITIGNGTFLGCSSLQSIIIPDSVTSIGDNAFRDCGALRSVIIGNSVTTIGNSTFCMCDNLTSITIPNSVTEIGISAFSSCRALKNVVFGNGVEIIHEGAFYNCDALTAVIIPDSVTKIGGWSFENCDALRKVSIGTGVETICDDAFKYCALTDIFVQSDNPAYCSVDDILFSKDKTILMKYPTKKNSVSYAIPNNVTTINDYAFYSCKNLAEITIGSSVTTIGDYAISYCYGLRNIIFTGLAPSIDSYAFSGTSATVFYPVGDVTWTESLRDGYGGNLSWAQPAYGTLDSGLVWDLETDGTLTFYGQGAIPDFAHSSTPWGKYTASIRNVVIPDSVTSIGSYAFYDCDALTAVSIPDSVTSIGNDAFYDCDALTAVSIPDGVTSIGNDAFYNCDALTAVSIPDSVTSIGSYAFYDCDALTTVTIGNGAKSIDRYAFWDCSSLAFIIIPNSVETIGTGAFRACFALKTIVFLGNAPTLNSNTFYSVTATVAYPSVNATWTEAKRQNYGGSLTWMATTFPAVLIHPENAAEYVGDTAAFSITASGSGLTYQWQYSFDGKNWVNCGLPGNKTNTLTVPVTEARNNAQFRCVITDSSGTSAASQAATLSAVRGLAITTQPVDGVGKVGDLVTFTVAVQGAGLTYQWQQRIDANADWTNVAGSTGSTLSVPLTAARIGYQFRCVVTDKRGDTVTSHPAALLLHNAITIAAHPEDVTAPVSDTAYFSVTANGDDLTYQWQYSFDGQNWVNCGLAGNKTDTLTVPVIEARNGAYFRCIVSAGGNSVASDGARLTVTKPAITIAAQPENVTAPVGDTAYFTVTADGSNLTYQWQYSFDGQNWVDCGLTGNKTVTLTVPVIPARNNALFRCIITANGTSVASDAARLIVTKPAVTIAAQPEDITAPVGDTAYFTVTADGSNLTYQWQYSFDNSNWVDCGLAGNKTDTLTVPVIEARNGAYFRCVVMAGGTSVASDGARLTVTKPAITITAQPEDITAPVGDTAYFTITADGSNLTYQWQYSFDGQNWVNCGLTGNKTDTLTVPVIEARNGAYFRCIITANGTSVASDAARLTVTKPAITITAQPEDVSAYNGDTAYFSVTVVGSDISYQWQYSFDGQNWVDCGLTGNKTDTLTVPVIPARNGAQFRCVFTDALLQTFVSDSAALTVI